MRGAGDQLSIGERIAFYRHRRGLSQAVLYRRAPATAGKKSSPLLGLAGAGGVHELLPRLIRPAQNAG